MIVETVAAAAEVKTSLTTSGLDDAIEKGRRFKSLTAIPGKSHMLVSPEVRGHRNEDLDRFYYRRPSFLFAYENMVAPDTIASTLAKATNETEAPPLDAVFLLDVGLGINFWNSRGTFWMERPLGTPVVGWDWRWDGVGVLATLIWWLLATMPRFGLRSSPILHYMFPGTTWDDTLPHSTARAGSGFTSTHRAPPIAALRCHVGRVASATAQTMHHANSTGPGERVVEMGSPPSVRLRRRGRRAR